MKRRTCLVAGLAGALAHAARADFRVEVSGVGSRKIPVAILPFRNERSAAESVTSVITSDFERCGVIQPMGGAGPQLDETSVPDLAPIRERSADAVLVGSVAPAEGGGFDVRFRLWDAVRARDLGGQQYSVKAEDLRLAAHRVADYVYEKLTGDKGVFSTRIAYVTRSGGRYDLWVAEADGRNARAALGSGAAIISPTWSADGRQLAYVSFESRKPVVYVHDIQTGRRRLVANFQGSNSAPAWSPDGKTLAVTLTHDGISQLYTIDPAGGAPRRLTESNAVDTEPVYAPDGKHIYFVSDRGGSPQIYRLPSTGGQPERITFTGSYNISPALGPDGRLLAYISRVNGMFKLHVMELATSAARAITDTTADEQPSFAPNGRLIIYATRLAGRDVLMTTTVDGTTRMPIEGQPGDIREPDWGPLVS